MNNYQVSVVTPFHNVDLNMFMKCFESMQNQTIGFENIEWIIVAHNCNDEYVEGLKKIVCKCPNIFTYVLNNDKHTASSPRNYGLSKVNTEYVGFLDGDDSYLPDCLEKAFNTIKTTDAQIALFRMEYELNDENAKPIDDLVLWNQCEDIIVVNRENRDYEKMYSGMFGWVTSRLFSMKFLRENELTFDENLIMFEDFHFFIIASIKADRLVYMPNTIGYHYLINEASTLQSRKSGETIIAYTKGLKVLYQTIKEYGIHTDFIQRSCLMLSRMILNSHDITKQQRTEIRDLLEEFVSEFKLLSPNKINSLEEVDELMTLPAEVILHTENPLDRIYVREVTDGIYNLAYILRKNAGTDFGTKYNFANIHTIADYQNQIPLMEGEDLNKYVYLQTNIGEKNILTSERTARYFLNNEGHFIPICNSTFEKYVDAFAEIVKGRHNCLFAYCPILDKSVNDNSQVGILNTAIVQEFFAKRYPKYKKSGTSFSSSIGIYFDSYEYEESQFYYRLMKDALLDVDLEHIVAFDVQQVRIAFELLESEWEELALEIERVSFSRADEIRDILKNGFDNSVASKLWPKLKLITAFGAGELYEERHKMKKYTGSITHNNGVYFSEASIFGKAVADESDIFERFEDNNDFFELISLKDDNVCVFSDAEIGKPYQLIITNQSGLYRYKSCHFICPVEKRGTTFFYKIY